MNYTKEQILGMQFMRVTSISNIKVEFTTCISSDGLKMISTKNGDPLSILTVGNINHLIEYQTLHILNQPNTCSHELVEIY